jgi:hypothetical protein
MTNPEINKTQNYPFPYKRVSAFGALCALLVPIIIVIFQTLLYGSMTSIALIGKIYFLFFSNLILMTIYTYTAKYLYEHIRNKRIEVGLSGIFVVITILVLNWLFLKNIVLGKTSSTDVFIILIIPFWGLLSIMAGYFLGGFFTKIRNKIEPNNEA